VSGVPGKSAAMSRAEAQPTRARSEAMGILSKIFGDSAPDKLPVSLTDANFDEEVLKSDIPVVVDFWGPGCAPCAKLEPILMKLAGKYDGRVKVCEAAIPQNIKAAQKFSVRGTPTLLYFRPRGRLVERVVGFRGRVYHEEIIDTELLDEPAG
jgi:thioredoxin 1